MVASLDGRWLAEHWTDKVIIWPRRTPDENGIVIGHSDSADGLGAFTRNSNRFVFAKTEEDQDGDVVSSDLYLWERGDDVATLIEETDLIEQQPVWSADEQSIFFVADAERGCTDVGGDVRWSQDIYRMSLEDHSVVRLTDEPGRTWRIGDSVGHRLFVSSVEVDDAADPSQPCRSVARMMHLIDQDGVVLRDLGQGLPRAVSPDGKHILFSDYELNRLKIRTLATGEEWRLANNGLNRADWVRARHDGS
jgi:hypothetical protein